MKMTKRNSWTYLLASLVVMAMMTVGALAQSSPQSGQAQQGQESSGKAQQAKVVNVDTAKNEISVKDMSGKEWAMRINTSTKITKDGKDITLADIKAGDMLTYQMEGSGDSAWAKSIVVSSTRSSD